MISLDNEYTVVLDACVLIPISLTDLLLRLAEGPSLFSPRWSKDILEEVERNLKSPKFGLLPEKAHYRIQCMESAFPEALVTGYEPFVQNMTNNQKDRHVLAAAMVAKADAILTTNSRDFPVHCLGPLGIEKITPDRFLINQWDLDSKLVAHKIRQQAEDGNRPLHALLDLLGKMLPRFIEEARGQILNA